MFSSYAVVFSGFLTLYFSGGISGLIALFFLAVFVLAWFIEETDWQISERIATALIIFFIPLLYFDWRYQLSFYISREAIAASSLAKAILILAAIKLLQKKANRDWAFIYLISFFEILLSAGMTISPLFVVALLFYLFFIVCSIIAFEIKKTKESINKQKETAEKPIHLRLSAISAVLLILILSFAAPLFFLLPRVGGTGIGSGLGNGTVTGFSDSIRLGQIAQIQQSDEIVMRARIEEGKELVKEIKWRGIALDYFTNLSWQKSRKEYNEPFVKTEKDFFIVDGFSRNPNLVTQTIYLEPLDIPNLFTLSRPVAFQGSFKLINKDIEGAITVVRSGSERFSYKAFSDISLPAIEDLKKDNSPYPIGTARYLQLPANLDSRIARLATEIINTANASNRYDKAKAIESYLQNNFGYTLNLKASGEQPLADFLFNVREGHCEYFATAMAVMLRTQGIATRVVTGFQSGEYNSTADIYIVRQRDAHAWVEVYFPQTNSWIAFDPTPAAGRLSANPNQAGILRRFRSYFDALETFWVQYVIAYDNQEQRSLISRISEQKNLQNNLLLWGTKISKEVEEWWKNIKGERGLKTSLLTASKTLFLLLLLTSIVLLSRFLLEKFRILLKTLKDRLFPNGSSPKIEFYERMLKILAEKGYVRKDSQTPLEFAAMLNMFEVAKLTEEYHQVRFGNKKLSVTEERDIEVLLKNLEEKLSQEKTRILDESKTERN
jgi:transglutaminase-like putative cysteine protease